MKNFKNWLGDIITMLLLMALLVIMFMTACSTRHKVEELKKESSDSIYKQGEKQARHDSVALDIHNTSIINNDSAVNITIERFAPDTFLNTIYLKERVVVTKKAHSNNGNIYKASATDVKQTIKQDTIYIQAKQNSTADVSIKDKKIQWWPLVAIAAMLALAVYILRHENRW